MRLATLIAVSAVVLMIPTSAAADEMRYLMPVKANPTCTNTLLQIESLKQRTWKAQTALGLRLTLSSSAPITSCKYARWVRDKWLKRAAIAEEKKQYYTLPVTNDWQTAVDIVQRVFPGSKSWLLSCSASEGGHGPFVYNRQGSGAAGWLQFMSGTFYGNADDAIAYTKNKGFIVPNVYRLDSPLGQALAGGYMWTRGWTHHWYGNGC